MDRSCSNCGSLPQPEEDFENQSQTFLQAAESLACALTDAPEMQSYLRLARAVRLDPQVRELTRRIHGDQPVEEQPGFQLSHDALMDRLEALPVVQEYTRAEAALRALLQAVDREISAAAGVPFALHAKPAACG